MAQVVPSLTSLPIDSTVAPSAEDIQNRLPSICVDYLSHDWQEEDVWASWRSMTRHKNEIANGVRLENASWRTWWKQRNKLRTISPETLNWLKDSDVTWLYGPLHTAVEPVPPTKIASAEERLGIVRHDSSTTQFSNNSANSANGGAPTKPILKHRTLSEMLTIPMPASPVLEAVQNDSIDDYDVEEGRPGLLHTKSDTNIVRKGLRRKSPPRGPIGSGGRTPVNPAELSQPGSGERTPEAGPASGGKKHISFNTFVEQCIAVDDPAEIPGIEEEADDTEDDDEDDGMLEMRSSSSASSSRSSRSSSRPSLSRHSSSSSQPEHMTIAKIAPTTLKALGSFPSPSPQIIYAPPEEYAAEHDDQTGITYRHSPSPGSERWGYNPSGSATEQAQKAQRIAVSPTWDDEDDYSVGFDYFSGPDLGVGDEYNTGQRAGGTRQVQSHVGSGASYGKGQQQQQQVSASNSATATPTVNQAPPQARWRAGSSSEDSSNQSSQNSTARPTPVQSPGGEIVGAVSPPQPGRSILKIRPPGHQAPEPAEISPTSSYFNFKPSAATGLGGLDQGVRRVIKEPAAGSLPLYDQADNAYFVQPGNPANNGPIATVQTPPLASPHSVPTSPAHSRSSDEPESRGRSSTRAGGSVSSVDKSTSRGSVASVSVSPNSARSPVQIPGGGAKYPKPSQGDPAAGTVKSPTPGPGQKQAGNVNPAQVQAAPPPQVPTPVGMSQPKDDVELKKEENAKKREEDKQQAEAEHDVESRGQEYVPERSSTPTPHSSPQITVRRMTDTSPSSLPHTQTFHIPDKAVAGSMGAVEAAENSAKAASAKRHSRVASLPNAGSSEAGMFRRSVSQTGGEDDGGLMSNIANTAKDLFGALWNYGGQPATTTVNGNVQQDTSSADSGTGGK